MAGDDWEDLVLVGRVARAHGNKGQVIVNPETDFPEERFRAGQVVYTDGPSLRRLTIADVRFHRGRPILGFDGVTTMDEAEALAGAELRVPQSELAALPDGTYYHHDLVGCEVRQRDGRVIGTVKAVEGPMNGSTLVVESRRGEVLIPLASEICVTVDPRRREIVIEPPEGLIELNEKGRWRE
ncbi:MAG TPA: ribosome maturation factor RimM [Vicinamibacterales bacterium]|nr:ribosome maturation factor RimM [Vicinamibacterales bacterium]